MPHKHGFARTITRIAAYCSAVPGSTIDCQIYKNGVATGVTATISTVTGYGSATGSVSVVAGDTITVYARRNGAISGTPDIVVLLEA